MATAALAGYTGELYLGGNKVGEMKDTTLVVERNAIDATTHDSQGWEESIYGIAHWTFTAAALMLVANAAQTAAYDTLVAGTTVTYKFQPKAQSGMPVYTGSGMITHWETASPTTDAAAIQLQGKGTGPLTRAAQP